MEAALEFARLFVKLYNDVDAIADEMSSRDLLIVNSYWSDYVYALEFIKENR